LRQDAFRALGGPCSIAIAPPFPKRIEEAFQSSRAELLRIEEKYSRFRESSLVSSINRLAGKQAVAIDEETFLLFSLADRLYTETNGVFDITTGTVSMLWDWKSRRIPSDAEVSLALQKVGWRNCVLKQDSIYLTQEGMQIDLGGLGKEYAVDRVATVLRNNQVSNALVNLSGDIFALGTNSLGQPWQVGIQHPRDQGKLLARISVSNGGLATSGDYERFFEYKGKRYCHIISPKTGYPVTHWQSVSVRADSCLRAGALASCCMLLGGQGLDLLRRSSVSFLAVDYQGKVLTRNSSSA